MIESEALRVPVAMGVKVTLIVQLPFGPMEVQLLVSAKSDGSVPVNAILETLIVPEPLTFMRVTVCGLLVVPTVCVAKVRLAGVSSTAVPTPLTETVCGLFPAVSVMVRVAVRLLMLVGLKETLIVQLELAPSDEPQVFVSVKSFGSDPAKAMLEMLTAVLEELARVTGWELLEVASN